jgi:formylglycine-generating enzyme required for sulfatase activity
MKSEKSVKALIGALEDPNWRVRSMVVTALGEIGSERAIRALIDRLRDDSWMVHWKAAYALGKIGTPGVFQVLSRLARTNNAFLENASKEVLQSLDVVTVPEKQTVPRLEYRSSDPYATMRLIPAGPFIMGNESGHDDEKPARQVFVPDFLIDAHEVTNYQYKQFDPAHDYPEGMEHFPVVNVTWADAQAYAAWIGKRLPTEAEWEKAARGDQGWLYPWGEEFEAARCNTEESGNRQLTRVDQYPNGQSLFGVYDLLGNVLEWTADRYRPYPGSQYLTPDFQENFVVLRGSSWIHQGRGLTCAARTYAPAENKSNFIGFRCVKNVE